MLYPGCADQTTFIKIIVGIYTIYTSGTFYLPVETHEIPNVIEGYQDTYLKAAFWLLQFPV